MDLSQISTEELMRMRGAPVAGATDLSGFSVEELLNMRSRSSLERTSAAAQDTAQFAAQIRREIAPGPTARLGRGFMDVGQGLKQGYLAIKDLATGSTEGQTYTRDVDEELARYERTRGRAAGVDWLRLAGNVAATLPAASVPGGISASLPIRMLAGAGAGGAASGVMYTPEGESKTWQVLLGSLLGGATPAGLTGGKLALRSVLGRGAGPRVLPAQLEGELKGRLRGQGLDWDKLAQEVKDSLMGDAQTALSAGGTLDDAMLKNKALIESVGARPTRASVTRLPKDWQAEMNLRGVAEGKIIAERHSENARAMTDYLGKLRAQTGGKTETALETGESAIGSLQRLDEAKNKAVTALYEAFRASGAKNARVPETKLMASLTEIIEEIGLDNVPPAVQQRLKDFGFLGGKRIRNLDVMQADLFNKLLNANRPQAGGGIKAVVMLQKALNESLLDVPIENKAGAEALLRARGAAAKRFSEQRAGKGIEAAIEGVAPDRFVQKFILNADARDMKAVLAELKKSKGGMQAVKDVKGHVLDTLLQKSTNSASLDDLAFKLTNKEVKFSGTTFGKWLDKIEPEKLHALFKPSELGALRDLEKASKLLTAEVPFSDVNYSRTASALVELMKKIGDTPFLSSILSMSRLTFKALKTLYDEAAVRKDVARALIGSAARTPEPALLPQLPVERFAPALGGAASYEHGE